MVMKDVSRSYSTLDDRIRGFANTVREGDTLYANPVEKWMSSFRVSTKLGVHGISSELWY